MCASSENSILMSIVIMLSSGSGAALVKSKQRMLTDSLLKYGCDTVSISIVSIERRHGLNELRWNEEVLKRSKS